MRVIIPAAGLGERLRPHTEYMPKCLVPVGGKPIIDRLMTRLHDAGVEDVICVVGHHADLLECHVAGLVKRPPVTFVRNKEYATANNIVSLLATIPFWDREFAIIDSDVLVSGKLMATLVAARGDVLVVDPGRSYADIDMAVELRDGAIWHLSKTLPAERVDGEYFGLSRWTVAGGVHLARIIRDMIAGGDTNTWYAFAIRELAKSIRIAPMFTSGGEWLEIDNCADLAAANAACAAGVPWSR